MRIFIQSAKTDSYRQGQWVTIAIKTDSYRQGQWIMIATHDPPSAASTLLMQVLIALAR